MVAVRVSVCDSAAEADKWWRKKYEGAESKKKWKPAAGSSCKALDSLELAKRAALLDYVWLTSHHIQDSKEHITMLSRKSFALSH